MADNSRMSKMSSKEDECIFSWKLFTGWDYMIGKQNTCCDFVKGCVNRGTNKLSGNSFDFSI